MMPFCLWFFFFEIVYRNARILRGLVKAGWARVSQEILDVSQLFEIYEYSFFYSNIEFIAEFFFSSIFPQNEKELDRQVIMG